VESRLLHLCDGVGDQVDVLGQVVLKTKRKEIFCVVHELQLVFPYFASWPHLQLLNISLIPLKTLQQQKTTTQSFEAIDPFLHRTPSCSDNYHLHALFHPKLGPLK